MRKLLLALGALIASAAFVPAAQADDCDPDDGAMEFAQCLAERKLGSLRKIMPPPGRPPMAISDDCDPDDDDFKSCMRSMRMPGMRRGGVPSGMRPKAEKIARPEAPAQAKPVKAAAEAGEGPACTKYMPNLGKSVPVPCVE